MKKYIKCQTIRDAEVLSVRQLSKKTNKNCFEVIRLLASSHCSEFFRMIIKKSNTISKDCFVYGYEELLYPAEKEIKYGKRSYFIQGVRSGIFHLIFSEKPIDFYAGLCAYRGLQICEEKERAFYVANPYMTAYLCELTKVRWKAHFFDEDKKVKKHVEAMYKELLGTINVE